MGRRDGQIALTRDVDNIIELRDAEDIKCQQ